MPLIGEAGQDPYPLPPSNDLVSEASAHQLYWSPAVRELVEVWTKARNDLAVTSALARSDVTYDKAANLRAWTRAPHLKATLKAAEDALVAQMIAELRGIERDEPGVPKLWRWWSDPVSPSLLRRKWREAKRREDGMRLGPNV